MPPKKSSAKTEKQLCTNDKPTFSNKRYCERCGYNLDLLDPTQIIEENGKMYCDICIKNLHTEKHTEKEFSIRVGMCITLKNATFCTPAMGGYPENVHQRLIVCENGYLVATTISDANGNDVYSEKIIERGFFAKSSMSEIANALHLHTDVVQSWDKMLKLIEYDKTIYGQSL